jgi:hypothetical protein
VKERLTHDSRNLGMYLHVLGSFPWIPGSISNPEVVLGTGSLTLEGREYRSRGKGDILSFAELLCSTLHDSRTNFKQCGLTTFTLFPDGCSHVPSQTYADLSLKIIFML